MANNIIEAEDFNPKRIYDALIKRCKSIKVWEIRCIVDEGWMGVAPFKMRIEDGVFICQVIAPTKRDAFIMAANKLPVIRFLTKQDDE